MMKKSNTTVVSLWSLTVVLSEMLLVAKWRVSLSILNAAFQQRQLGLKFANFLEVCADCSCHE